MINECQKQESEGDYCFLNWENGENMMCPYKGDKINARNLQKNQLRFRRTYVCNRNRTKRQTNYVSNKN